MYSLKFRVNVYYPQLNFYTWFVVRQTLFAGKKISTDIELVANVCNNALN